MSRAFYAIVYAYGRNMINGGTRADHVHHFRTVAERARFVADHDGNPSDVDAASSTHPLVRKAVRADRAGCAWPQAV